MRDAGPFQTGVAETYRASVCRSAGLTAAPHQHVDHDPAAARVKDQSSPCRRSCAVSCKSCGGVGAQRLSALRSSGHNLADTTLFKSRASEIAADTAAKHSPVNRQLWPGADGSARRRGHGHLHATMFLHNINDDLRFAQAIYALLFNDDK